MKIIDAIKKADSLYPNNYTEEEKLDWCFELTKMLCCEYLKNEEIGDLTSENFIEKETLVSSPYDEMYVDFLLAKCCYYQRDYDTYNRHIMLFNSKLSDFSNRYIEENMPVRKTKNSLNGWW